MSPVRAGARDRAGSGHFEKQSMGIKRAGWAIIDGLHARDMSVKGGAEFSDPVKRAIRTRSYGKERDGSGVLSGPKTRACNINGKTRESACFGAVEMSKTLTFGRYYDTTSLWSRSANRISGRGNGSTRPLSSAPPALVGFTWG